MSSSPLIFSPIFHLLPPCHTLSIPSCPPALPLYTSSSLLFLFHPSGFPHIHLSVLRTSPCNASDAAMSSEHNESGCRAPSASRYLSHLPPPTRLLLQPQRASPLHLPSHLPLPSVRTAVQHGSCRRLTLKTNVF